MKKLLALMLYCLCMVCHFVYAQPTSVENWMTAFQRAGTYLQVNDMVAARKELNQSLVLAKTATEKANSKLMLARLDMIGGKAEQARKVLTELASDTNLEPHIKVMAQSAIGDSYSFEQKFEQARLEYAKIIDIKDIEAYNKADAISHIASTYIDEKKFDQARAEYAKILALKGTKDFIAEAFTLTFAQLEIGQSYIKEEKFIQARTELTKVLDYKMDKVPAEDKADVLSVKGMAQLDIAQTYFKEKNYEQAKKEYQKVLLMKSLDPNTEIEARKQLQAITELQKKR
jgi:tetratricopeptide (TPR) repeat protein